MVEFSDRQAGSDILNNVILLRDAFLDGSCLGRPGIVQVRDWLIVKTMKRDSASSTSCTILLRAMARL
jgi:hypothetical protein